MTYVVISPPDWIDCRELHMYLIGLTDFAPSRCVLENGKDGKHPHLNYVVADAPSYVDLMGSLEEYVKTKYYPCGQRRRMTATMRKHILRMHTIYDTNRLDTYLAKEEGAEVLPCGENPPEVHIEWEFEWHNKLPHETFASYLLYNLRNWLSNYPIIEQVKILRDENKYDLEVRKMLFSTGNLSVLLKYNGCRYDVRMAVLKTLRTELNTGSSYDNNAHDEEEVDFAKAHTKSGTGDEVVREDNDY